MMYETTKNTNETLLAWVLTDFGGKLCENVGFIKDDVGFFCACWRTLSAAGDLSHERPNE